MVGEPEPKDELFGMHGQEREATLVWFGEHLTLMRQSAYGQRVRYWILGLGFVVGLAAHVGGFLLRDAVTPEPLLLLADLLYALGFALWTGVVVAIFVDVWPAVKKRQYQQALHAYEAARRENSSRETDR